MSERATAKVVDFSNVKEVGEFAPRQVPTGDYLAQITKVVDAQAKDGESMYLFTFKLRQYSQNSYPYYCKLVENQLWKLRNILIAGGLNVPKARAKVDPGKLVGRWVGVTMEDDEYEGKLKSVIASVFPASELDDSDPSNTLSSNEEEDEGDEDQEYEEPESDEVEEEAESEEEEEEDSGDEYDGMDREALKRAIRAQDASFKFLKSQSDDDLRAVLRTSSGNDEDEELEELEIDDL